MSPDLNANKVIAGAGAAATSAVFGSFFGATGTVAGAAIGSVVSTVGAALYQRSLDRTRDRVRARVRLPGGRTASLTHDVELPAPRASQDAAAPARVVASPAIAPRPRGRLAFAGAAMLLVFALGLMVVTGLEWVKGSALTTSEPGTSIGRVFGGAAGAVPDGTESSTGSSDSGDSNTPGTTSARKSTSTAPSSAPRTRPTDGPGRSSSPIPDRSLDLLPVR